MAVKVSTHFIESILKTLPIGYYLGSKVEVVLDTAAPTSFVSLVTREIHVAAKNIYALLEGWESDSAEETEQALRTMLYHEVSHLALTPTAVKNYFSVAEDIPDWFNIIEDERIETLLAKFYMGINFKRAVFTMNWTPDWQPKDARDLFFGICRFRQGPKEFVERVASIIAAARNVNCQTYVSPYSSDGEGNWYIKSAKRLWLDVVDYWNNNQQNQQQEQNQQQNQQNQQNQQGQGSDEQNQENQSSSQNQQSNGGSSDKDESKDEQGGESSPGAGDEQDESEDKGKGEQSSGDQKDENSDSNTQAGAGQNQGSDSDNGKKELDENAEGEEETESGVAAGEEGEGDDESEEQALEKAVAAAEEQQSANGSIPDFVGMQKIIAKVFQGLLDTYVNPEIAARLQRMIVRCCKRKGLFAGAHHGYAGRIDPRAVGTDRKYRWFEKRGDDGTSKYSKVHITFWVDNSGSFSGAIGNINCLIAAALQVEKMIPQDFSFDVVTMSDKNVIHDKKTAIVAHGCNYFGPNVAEINKKLEPRNCRHFNVAVWDGPMANSRREYSVDDYRRRWMDAFRVFDNSNSIIVSDLSNQTTLLRMCKKARKEFIAGDYASVFVDKVLGLLDQLLG